MLRIQRNRICKWRRFRSCRRRHRQTYPPFFLCCWSRSISPRCLWPSRVHECMISRRNPEIRKSENPSVSITPSEPVQTPSTSRVQLSSSTSPRTSGSFAVPPSSSIMWLRSPIEGSTSAEPEAAMPEGSVERHHFPALAAQHQRHDGVNNTTTNSDCSNGNDSSNAFVMACPHQVAGVMADAPR